MTTTQPRVPARGEGDRRLLRLGRGRQDDGGRGGGARRREPARRQGARAHDRPRQAARRRARARGDRQHREAGAGGSVQDRGARGPGRALGCDARHQAVVGRAGAAPRPTRRPRTGSSTTSCTRTSPRFVQSHDYIAMERLFEIHETGRFDLIVIDTPPTGTRSTSSTRRSAWRTSSAAASCGG